MARGASVLTGSQRYASGRRDAAVTIQRLTEGVGASGAPTEAWTTLARVQMNRLDVRADEHFTANQESAFVNTIWQMPYMADMDPDAVDVQKSRRLVYSGRSFDIRAAVNIGRMKGIELHTLAGSRIPSEGVE